MRRSTKGVNKKITIAATTKVYGRRKASLTIHIVQFFLKKSFEKYFAKLDTEGGTKLAVVLEDPTLRSNIANGGM
jgi:hypothetical protein